MKTHSENQVFLRIDDTGKIHVIGTALELQNQPILTKQFNGFFSTFELHKTYTTTQKYLLTRTIYKINLKFVCIRDYQNSSFYQSTEENSKRPKGRVLVIRWMGLRSS